jgi:hypothetical protein
MLHRRDAMLRLGTAACGALSLPHLLKVEQAAAATGLATGSSARSCIFLFMWGGQPQQDMWDLKPDAPTGVRSHFRPIDTIVPGITLSDQMPRIAGQTDKLAIIRSLNHSATDHGISVYHALTGRAMSPPRTFPGNARPLGRWLPISVKSRRFRRVSRFRGRSRTTVFVTPGRTPAFWAHFTTPSSWGRSTTMSRPDHERTPEVRQCRCRFPMISRSLDCKPGVACSDCSKLTIELCRRIPV